LDARRFGLAVEDQQKSILYSNRKRLRQRRRAKGVGADKKWRREGRVSHGERYNSQFQRLSGDKEKGFRETKEERPTCISEDASISVESSC